MILFEIFFLITSLFLRECICVFNKMIRMPSIRLEFKFSRVGKAREKSCCMKSLKQRNAIGIGYLRVTRDRVVLLVLLARSLDEKGRRRSERCVSLAQAILFHYSSNLFSEEAYSPRIRDVFRHFAVVTFPLCPEMVNFNKKSRINASGETIAIDYLRFCFRLPVGQAEVLFYYYNAWFLS